MASNNGDWVIGSLVIEDGPKKSKSHHAPSVIRLTFTNYNPMNIYETEKLETVYF